MTSTERARGDRPRRGVRLQVGAVAVAVLAVAGCSSDGGAPAAGGGDAPAQAGAEASGPFFPECGGISDQRIGEVTQVQGLVNTAKTSVGCQWLVQGGISGPHFSFTWFRGSPIGRERKTVELSRTSVTDVEIEGRSGFEAVGDTFGLGPSICEIGIQYGSDFIEWSVSYVSQPYPDPCDVARELTGESIRAAS